MMTSLMIDASAMPEVDPKNKARAEEYWMYGQGPAELAKAWGKDEAVAALKTCGNCEYFNNSARVLKALGGEAGQGACMKFKFMCSQEASCQAWESGEHGYMEEED